MYLEKSICSIHKLGDLQTHRHDINIYQAEDEIAAVERLPASVTMGFKLVGHPT